MQTVAVKGAKKSAYIADERTSLARMLNVYFHICLDTHFRFPFETQFEFHYVQVRRTKWESWTKRIKIFENWKNSSTNLT